METNISQRLLDVASYIPKGSKLLDVGSDHAYLPIHLLQQGWIESAIAGEVVQGPYQAAVANVAKAQLADKLEVRLADGLAAFEETDGVTAIAICGMGGRLIGDILAKGRTKLDQVERLILQPNNCEDELRSWLADHGFKIVAEKIMTENQKFYEIIVAEHGKTRLSDLEKRFGPCLLQEQSSVFLARWQGELAKLERALERVPKDKQADRSALLDKINAIKEVMSSESK